MMLSSRMRNASTSPSRRPPSGVAVLVRRATCPSTASRTSATLDRVTSAMIDTGRLNESATRPATPAISTARVRVSQSAGCMDGWSLRARATASSAAAAEPVASPAIQPATARPAVADTTPSRAAVASIPSIDVRKIVGSASSAACLSASSAAGLSASSSACLIASSSAGLIALIVPPSPQSPAAVPSGRTGPLSHRFTATGRALAMLSLPTVELCVRPARVTLVAALHTFSAGAGPVVRRFGLPLLRLAAGVTVLWFIWRQLGAAPFRDGLRAVTWPAVAAAVTLTALTTVCSAWRWRVVARTLGVGMSLPSAVSAYYRSLFLNSVLVGGVLGDVHRAVTHGRRAGDVARGLRAVAWERLCGQVIQAMLTVVVLLTLPSPVRPALPYVVAGVAGVAGCAALVVRGAARRGRSRLARTARAVSADLRCGLLARDVWPQLALSSVLVVAGHTATFVIAARVAGCTAPLGELVALLMVVQVAAVIPLGIGGGGLREGAAAWAFSAAGLGAVTGVTVTILYAVLMLAAVAPGAGLLLGDAVRRRRSPGNSGESRRRDLAPQPLEAVRG